jgi:hypothetical protein
MCPAAARLEPAYISECKVQKNIISTTFEHAEKQKNLGMIFHGNLSETSSLETSGVCLD